MRKVHSFIVYLLLFSLPYFLPVTPATVYKKSRIPTRLKVSQASHFSPATACYKISFACYTSFFFSPVTGSCNKSSQDTCYASRKTIRRVGFPFTRRWTSSMRSPRHSRSFGTNFSRLNGLCPVSSHHERYQM